MFTVDRCHLQLAWKPCRASRYATPIAPVSAISSRFRSYTTLRKLSAS